jgi:alcohol dehydrogenase class IV
MVSYHKQVAPFLFGAGAVAQLGEQLVAMGATKAILVTDKGVVAAGVMDKATASLEAGGFPYVVFDGCLPDAPDPSVFAAAKLAREEKIDVIVGIGGGSDLDTAKAASTLIVKEKTLDEVKGPEGPPIPQVPDVKLVLIPTTSGTGSEETFTSVLSDHVTGVKFGVFITHADLSIVDPELTLGLPPALTASTGMDTIAHSIEAYTTLVKKNPLSDQRALAAIRLTAKWLPVAVRDGGNLEARTNMSLACTLAGMAFTDSMCNFAHGIAHAFGAKSHLAHGLGCALAEPAAIESFAEAIPGLIRDIGEALGAAIPADAAPKEIGKITGDALRSLMKSVDIPTLEKLGLSREDVLAHRDMVLGEFQTWLAPIKVTPEIAETVLASMYDDYR